MSWWTANKLRLIQNNLRETDADLDVGLLMKELQQFRANTLMINAGGIFAFYPSSLEHQVVTPYLKKDLLGEVISQAHARNIRVIARFDFSKAHESLFSVHPEWFYRDREGREVNYFGIVHTCLNGEYQQEKSLESIGEVLERYEVDGIFFNMFGYQHWDYSGNHYGPCYCGNCIRRFRELCGEELADYTGPGHALHQVYRNFQEQTSRAILAKIHHFVKAKWPDVAISTYHPYMVDIVRKESNTSLTRPYPLWLYSASENVASVEQSWDDKLISNCSINAIDLTYRFTGVSPQENEIRLYQNIANGSGLDFCIIGAFAGYPDRKSFPAVQEVFRFHAEHEPIFGNLISLADVVLIKPAAPEAAKEYMGLFKMLKESHVLFDTIVEEQIPARQAALARAKVVILPGLQHADTVLRDILRNLQRQGVSLLATGCSFLEDEETLSALFAASYTGSTDSRLAGYLDVSDEFRFPSLKDRHWITASSGFARMVFDPDEAVSLIPYIEPSTFGPPERAYGHSTGQFSGLGIVRCHGEGAGVYYAWHPGAQYAKHGFEDHKHVVMDILTSFIGSLKVVTDIPESVELFFNRLPNGNCLLQLINLSGFNGITYLKAISMYQMEFHFNGIGLPERAYSLRSGEEISVQAKGEGESDGEAGFSLTVPHLDRYEAVVLEFPGSGAEVGVGAAVKEGKRT
ncbi:family 10 glycosylhydrolase [Paenibacillus medicaginis]|uniref:Family 10 glycosylhydrolase n=1 Tax=Paenibacillus medicaginis TaxID=1470560 RepID=A0ABV5C283_9BACL